MSRGNSRLRRLAVGLAVAAFFSAPALVRAQSTEQVDQPSEKTWTEIKDNIFNGVPLEDGTGLVSLETPLRAEDAAIVPVSMKITLPEGDPRTVKRFTLVIDENPAPLAGTFDIGPSSGVTAISTRVRVNSYTYVHAAAELSDGKTYVVKNYVKASGGCSAQHPRTRMRSQPIPGRLSSSSFPNRAEQAIERTRPRS